MPVETLPPTPLITVVKFVRALIQQLDDEADRLTDRDRGTRLRILRNRLDDAHRVLTRRALEDATPAFAAVLSELKAEDQKLKATLAQADQFVKTIETVRKIVGIVEGLAGIVLPRLLMATAELPSAALPPAAGAESVEAVVWALWREGGYEARVRVLGQHPTSPGFFRVEGVQGRAYVDGALLRVLDPAD